MFLLDTVVGDNGEHAPPRGQGRSRNAGLARLRVLLFAGVGFAVHFAWIIAAIFFVIWLVGFGLGRGKRGQAPLLPA